MEIREGSDRIEISVAERVPGHLPGAGDVLLKVAVRSREFGGAGSAWVDARTLRSFVGQLRDLGARRQGAAELESMSPREFLLRVFSTDRRGHMAVAGRVAHDGQAVEFEFSFCPTTLPRLVAAFAAVAGEP